MEPKKRIILLNVTTSGTQVVFVGLVYFFLYRYLLSKLGVELLGVWSLVLSASSLTTLANFGITDSVIRFVALYSTEKDNTKIKQLIFTASLFLLGLFIGVAAIIYPLAKQILPLILPAKYIGEGVMILPYSLVCLIINAVGGVYSSVLDGIQKNYIRNAVFSTSSIILLCMVYLLVPAYKLRGVALAQLAQSLFTLLFCLFFVIFQLKYNPFKWRWSKEIFKQISGYGVKFQFMSLIALFYDPMIRVLIDKFGGLAFVGYYEMANRLLSQIRSVFINATQSLVPVLVNISKQDVLFFYKRIFSNVAFCSLAATCLTISSGRIISFYWIGYYQPIFYFTLIILSFGIFFNLIATPAYFYFMAKAKLNTLIFNHLIICSVNIIVSLIIGYLFNWYVVLGWSLALSTGSICLLSTFNKYQGISFKELINTEDLRYSIALLFILFLEGLLNKLDFKIIDSITFLIISIITIYYFFKYKFAQFKAVNETTKL